VEKSWPCREQLLIKLQARNINSFLSFIGTGVQSIQGLAKLFNITHILILNNFSVDDAKYLYHDGTSWKFGNVAMLKPEKFENLLFCTTCGQVILLDNL
jgi:hypothetical protein